MPGLHNTDKFKLVGCWCERDFLTAIDRARGELGRSQFLRDALLEKLAREGIHIPREKTVAPDRAGKGGPHRRIRLQPRANSIAPSEVKSGVAKVAEKLSREDQKS